MKNTQPLVVNDRKKPPACLRLTGRCFPFRGSYQPDSESEGEEEVDNSASLSEFVDPILGDDELDINPSSLPAAPNNDQRITDGRRTPIKKTLKRGLSLRGQQALRESITGLGIDDEIKECLIRNANGLFALTGLFEEKARGFGSQFLGLQDGDEESESVGDRSDDKSAELTPRLNRDDFQESVVNGQSLASEFDTQTSRVTGRPSSEVINPRALTIGDVIQEDSNFRNALKIMAFDYINQACEFGLNIKEEEKIKYFNISLDMIEEKKEKIFEAYKNPFKKIVVNSLKIVDGKQISEDEKIKLFDLINKIIELPAERGDKIQEKMKQLIFVLKALKSQKSKILNGLDKRIRADTERPGSTR